MLRNAQLIVLGPLLHTLKHHVVAGCEDLINFRRKTNNKSCSYCTTELLLSCRSAAALQPKLSVSQLERTCSGFTAAAH